MADDMWTYMGPLGNLLPIRCPAPNLDASRYVESSVAYTIEGLAKVQRGVVGYRSFDWSLDYATPSDIDNLNALFQGLWGPGPFWWYDPMSAKRNMLKPESAAPFSIAGRAGFEIIAGAGGLSDNALETEDGSGNVISPRSMVMAAGVTAASPHVPVIVGSSYAAIGYARPNAAGSASVGIAFYDVSGTIIGAATSESQAAVAWGELTPGPVAAPAGAVSARLLLASVGTLASFGNLRLAEGDVALTHWAPGQGIPQVSILAVPESYQAAWDETRSDYTAQLQEV